MSSESKQQSLLEISIKHLNDNGIGKIIVVTGHAFNQVRKNFLQSGFRAQSVL